MKKSKRTILVIALAAVVACFSIPCIANQITPSNYDDLNSTDRAMLNEVSLLSQSESKNELWPGYHVVGEGLFALKSTGEGGYLINPSKTPNSFFAKRVSMPEESGVEVYRVAGFSPDMFQFFVPSNFNSLDQRCSVLGSSVYFLRYNNDSFNKEYDSGHFSTMLAHERFHYEMQNNWKGTSRPDTEVLTSSDLNLLSSQYYVLDGFADLHDSGEANKEELTRLVSEYIAITEQRKAANPEYLIQEQQAETIEGTATYVGVKASKAVGYPFDIMKTSKDGEEAAASFSMASSLIANGSLPSSTIGTDFVYQSGALLCWVLDALEVSNWQERLNAQTAENPITLYDLLKENS